VITHKSKRKIRKKIIPIAFLPILKPTLSQALSVSFISAIHLLIGPRLLFFEINCLGLIPQVQGLSKKKKKKQKKTVTVGFRDYPLGTWEERESLDTAGLL
jgi:hypothetical protein